MIFNSKDLFSETDFAQTQRDRAGFYDDLEIDSALMRQGDDEDNEDHNEINQAGFSDPRLPNPFHVKQTYDIGGRQEVDDSEEDHRHRFPQITKSSINSDIGQPSSVNYPNGVNFINQTRQQKVFKQYRPIKNVPKIIDLTRDTQKMKYQTYDQEEKNQSFIHGRQANEFQQHEIKLPDKYLFEEFKYQINQFYGGDARDVLNDPAFIRKEKLLNLQAQTSIYQMKDYKPF